MDHKISYSINEAAVLTGIGRTKLYELMNRGELPRVKIGLRTVLRHRDLEALLDRNLVRSTA